METDKKLNKPNCNASFVGGRASLAMMASSVPRAGCSARCARYMATSSLDMSRLRDAPVPALSHRRAPPSRHVNRKSTWYTASTAADTPEPRTSGEASGKQKLTFVLQSASSRALLPPAKRSSPSLNARICLQVRRDHL